MSSSLGVGPSASQLGVQNLSVQNLSCSGWNRCDLGSLPPPTVTGSCAMSLEPVESRQIASSGFGGQQDILIMSC